MDNISLNSFTKHYNKIWDSIIKSENVGLFGLRKTGKTSILFKLERQLDASKTGYFIYLDCKSPSIRKSRWNELYERICKEICNKLNLKFDGPFDEKNVADTFAELIGLSQSFGKIIIIFDEIEYISPISHEPHWKIDFIDFWHTFWATQSRFRNISSIIVGVNPYPLEIDTIDGIQNPLFGIVSNNSIKGLEKDDVKIMIKTLGKPMGLRFEDDSIEYIYKRFGGHPLLTRVACSFINTESNTLNEERPVTITCDKLKKYEEALDSVLSYYCGHVISVLKEFYRSEYDLLELLSSGQVKTFIDKTKHPNSTKHLIDYGLLTYDNARMPKISIPVIQKYIGTEYAIRENRTTIYKLIEPENRLVWINNMKKSIIADMRYLERTINSKNMQSLYGPNSFPEAEEFFQLGVVDDKSTYTHFMNTCYRCFVESIDIYGNHCSEKDYFWKIMKAYPSLGDGLYRIRLYRHFLDHVKLKQKPESDFKKYFSKDTEGKNPLLDKDIYFRLQQCTLDGLLNGIQSELNILTS